MSIINYASVPEKARSKVGLDAIALPMHFSGAAHYIVYLIRALLQTEREFGFVIFCKPVHYSLFEKFVTPKDRIVTLTIKNRFQQLYFYEFRLPIVLRKFKVDIFHAMHYITPRPDKNYRLITTFHDMGFFLHKNYYSPFKRLYFKNMIPQFIKRTDHIVTVSEQSQKSVIKFFPHAARKTSVVYPGTDHFGFNSKLNQRDGYLLAVNTFEKRKNATFLIDVFERLKQKYRLRHKLLLVGQPANDYQKLLQRRKSSPFASEIDIRVSVGDADLKKIYERASMFLSASVYEGFGFTPLEAINLDCPVFLFGNTAVQEIIGKHNSVFEHLEIEKWAESIHKSINQPEKNIIDRQHIKHLTWDNTALRMNEIYKMLLQKEEIENA